MNDLLKLRNNIDEIDNELIELLKKRFSIVIDVKKYKSINKLPVLDENREKEINLKLKNKSGNFYKEIDLIYQAILKVSKDLQNE
ncbi:MAG: chorismate mutase [Acholeplasmataceae bacterium]